MMMVLGIAAGGASTDVGRSTGADNLRSWAHTAKEPNDLPYWTRTVIAEEVNQTIVNDALCSWLHEQEEPDETENVEVVWCRRAWLPACTPGTEYYLGDDTLPDEAPAILMEIIDAGPDAVGNATRVHVRAAMAEAIRRRREGINGVMKFGIEKKDDISEIAKVLATRVGPACTDGVDFTMEHAAVHHSP